MAIILYISTCTYILAHTTYTHKHMCEYSNISRPYTRKHKKMKLLLNTLSKTWTQYTYVRMSLCRITTSHGTSTPPSGTMQTLLDTRRLTSRNASRIRSSDGCRSCGCSSRCCWDCHFWGERSGRYISRTRRSARCRSSVCCSRWRSSACASRTSSTVRSCRRWSGSRRHPSSSSSLHHWNPCCWCANRITMDYLVPIFASSPAKPYFVCNCIL